MHHLRRGGGINFVILAKNEFQDFEFQVCQDSLVEECNEVLKKSLTMFVMFVDNVC